MLEHEGLERYIDPRCLQREIADATDLTPADLDRAARELTRSRKNSPAQQTGNANSNPSSGASSGNNNSNSRPPYYEHLGGFSMQEMKDYNQYSRQDDLLKPQRGYSQDYSDDNDDMVYVTTL